MTWLLLLVGCAFITQEEYAARQDRDADGYVSEQFGGIDCDDDDGATHPDAEDPLGDGVDANCDGALEFDVDGDGFEDVAQDGADCDDGDPEIHPDATETWYDGIDQDCDGANDYDQDFDGFDVDVDCDDRAAAVNPDATETFYDGVDQDCDGSNDFDQDADGFVHEDYNARAGGTAPDTGDCDDLHATAWPGAEETWYDGIDQDCDGANDYDQDADGHVDAGYNAFAGGTAPGTGDCDDLDESRNPGVPESWYDGVDEDCDGANDYDQDADGFECDGSLPDSPCPAHVGDDCHDDEPDANPEGDETWYDGIDGNCDGQNDFDKDGDTYVTEIHSEEAGGTAPHAGDCNDDNGAINPGATENVLTVNIDEDCDGNTMG